MVLAIYGFSKINSCREFLMAPPFQIDRVINKLSLLESPRIKANCARAYKNFNSDLNEAIEEGAVASLIAMSLEGKLKNQSSDEFLHPDVIPQKDRNIAAPACAAEISQNPTEAQWFEKVKVTNGGAAGKGPDPPEPPATSIDGSSEYPNMAEELDAGEIEGKTKMAFAKMQVPQGVKESHLLSDTDFMLNADRDRDEASANESTLDADDAESMAESEAKEALAAQLAAQDSVISNQSKARERTSSFKQQRSRGNSFRGTSRSNSRSHLLSGNNSETESPRLAPLDGATSPEMPFTTKKDKGGKRVHSQSAGNPILKPIAHKEPTMAEQAARLGLFTLSLIHI